MNGHARRPQKLRAFACGSYSELMHPLAEPALAAVLNRLHEAAAADPKRWAARKHEQANNPPPAGPDPLVRMGELYIAVSRDEGRFLYLLARLSGARHMVEFGASYGISTLYLGAAARANGGQLHTTEVHPDKCAVVRNNIAEAGLQEAVSLLEGDALETLQTVDAPIDFVFLDGWKSYYLPVIKLLRPKLAPGALVVADNIDFSAAADYLAYVQETGNGFFTQLQGDLALSYLDA